MGPRGRDLAKRAAYRSGALRARASANRGHLTVVTFHRVLPEGDPRWRTADPRFTVTEGLLGECLRFFDRHYDLVGVDAVLEAAGGGAPLPPHQLLVTFDDGWADTAQHALPVLRACGCPSVVFVTSGAVGRRAPFWRERLFAACRAGRVDPGRAPDLWAGVRRVSPPGPDADPDAIRAFVGRVDALPAPARARALAAVERLDDADDGRQMVTLEELRRLRDGGVAIGAHGASHEPIPEAPDLDAELAVPRAALAAALEEGDPDALATVSFPHGRWDGPSARAARAAGYRLLFTSEAILNPLRDGRPGSDLVGRIPLPGPDVSDERGRLRPELLALWLFRRPRAAVPEAA
jgi:peptidoglycan/xylan/chitin deacetylase (PgdA/CDA1 family)